MEHSVYIVFAATPYRIGKAIQHLTKEYYNHACIALDEELTQMFGFARRFYRTPLYGGFVRESLSRHHVNGSRSQICLCKLPVTHAQYEAVRDRLLNMYDEKEKYLYNHLSVLSAPLRRPVKLRCAYTCVEFCVDVLQTLGFPLDPHKYYSIGDLQQFLQTYVVYEGPIPMDKSFDTVYYAKRPVRHPMLITVRDFFRLFSRA